MNNLNTVLPNGTFGVAVNTINANFSLIVNAINSLEYASTKSKGIHNYGFVPSTTTIPNAVSGDWCMVLGSGNTFPAQIWTSNGTSWSQGGTWNPESIDLTDYASKTELTTAIADSLAKATARMGYGVATANGNAYSVAIANYTLPANGGAVHVKMPSAATGACTLNINSTGAKTLLYNGAAVSSANTWEQNEIISVFYDPSGSGQYLASNSQGGGGNAGKIKYDNSQSGLAAENVQEALDELNEENKVWENDGVADGARYIHTDYTYAIDDTQPTWRVTYHISLEDKRGQIIHFPKVYKGSQDMFTYVLYTNNSQSYYIAGSGYKVTSRSESLTWGEIAVDDILEQYPTARYIKFTLNTNFYHQPYTTIPILSLSEQIEKTRNGIKEDSLIFKNEAYSDQRYIHTDGSFPADAVTHTWKITGTINLRELVGCTIYFYRIYKSAQNMLAYALYAGQASSSFINGAYVSDAITQQSENLTWDSLSVDDILRQYPTARYIRFTLHGSFLSNQPYAVSSLKGVLGCVKINTQAQSISTVLDIVWTSSKRIDANGGVSDCSESFTVSEKIQLSQLSAYILVGYDCFSTAYDTRTWALYNSSNVCVAVSEPTDSHSYSRQIFIDTQELLAKYPSATQIMFGCHINFLFELVERNSVIARVYQNEINAERPSKGGLDNFTFASAGSSGVINVVSNTDADVTQYETLGVNFAQVLKIGNYYACFYYASSASGEYNQAIFCAYSSNGTTWTRGFPPNITPPVAGTNKLFDNTASGYKPITESCWCRVPDKDYPYRMIANRNMSGTNKSCWMWKSADGYHYELMGQILGDAYRPDTQYSAVVRGNVIKLYLRISETIGSGSSSQYKRSIAVAYLDLDGNILTPPYKLIYDYRYTSAACVLDNTRELLIPTWFANNINSAPKTENAYLETFIVEGDKYEKIDTNINDCLNDDTLWVAVAPDFVTINNEQYICVNERNTDHASARDKSSIKLVKVTRS